MNSNLKIGLLGDSHLIRMSEFIGPEFNIYGKGGKMALNWRNYQNAMVENDFLVVFMGGNDITGRLGERAPSSLSGLCQSLKEIDNFCKENQTVLLSCDLVPRMANLVGTDHANHRLQKRYKARHIGFAPFIFVNASDGVHLYPERYVELWPVFKEKILSKVTKLSNSL